MTMFTKEEQSRVKAMLANPKLYRKRFLQAQTEFWQRYAVGQSGGSRYEAGRLVPQPTAVLMAVFELGFISDEELTAVRDLVAEALGVDPEVPAEAANIEYRPKLRRQRVSK